MELMQGSKRKQISIASRRGRNTRRGRRIESRSRLGYHTPDTQPAARAAPCRPNSVTLIDITRKLDPTLAVWPGDAPFRLHPQAQMAAGEIVNVTSLHLSAHTGTHVDAFHHYVDGATAMDGMDLTLYWGPAQVVTVEKPAGPLFPADFDAVDLARASRLLLRSSASHADPTRFFRDYVYPDPALAAALGRHGIRLFGTDAPSVDPPDSATLSGHHALFAAGIAILEGLSLAHVADGLYELVALPLKIAGGDGSPVRAVLRPLEA